MTKKAFTLVEMLIVIVIIGILAAALYPQLVGIQSRARDSSREAGLNTVMQALELYAVDHNGVYPKSNGDTKTLLDMGDGKTFAKYLKKNSLPDNGLVGLLSNNDGVCAPSSNEGVYAYYNKNNGVSYVVTAALESETAATVSDCKGTFASKTVDMGGTTVALKAIQN